MGADRGRWGRRAEPARERRGGEQGGEEAGGAPRPAPPPPREPSPPTAGTVFARPEARPLRTTDWKREERRSQSIRDQRLRLAYDASRPRPAERPKARGTPIRSRIARPAPIARSSARRASSRHATSGAERVVGLRRREPPPP